MAAEVPPEPSPAGSVVLDIGGDVGAVVVRTPASLLGEEIEVRRAGGAWDGRHVAVLRRDLPGSTLHAAVFAQLRQGRWEVRRRDDRAGPVVAVEVDGGRVSTVDLG